MQPVLFPTDAPELPEHEVAWLVAYLKDKGWQTATQILFAHGQPTAESPKRRIRMLAAGSGGRIAGGQNGYKLVEDMTRDEYDHWRNWITSQADEMRRRVIKSDKIFYSRKTVEAPIKGPMPKFGPATAAK